MKTNILMLTLWAAITLMPVFSTAQGLTKGTAATATSTMQKVNGLAELNVKATQVQFKNRATGEWIVLAPSPGGGGSLVAGSAMDGTPWHFYQAAGAEPFNVEFKRNNFDAFNWSPYDLKTDEASFIAWNHAKRQPNNTTPAAPHQFLVEDAGNGYFRIQWLINKEYVELVPTIIEPLSNTARIITRLRKDGNLHQEWEIWADVKNAATTYTPISAFAYDKNPFGPFEGGYGIVGGEFTQYTNLGRRGTGQIIGGPESWKGIYINPGKDDMVMGEGFIVKTGMVVMHPGNGQDHLSKLRFTAPADGSYAVDVKWTAIDNGAKKSWTWVFTNATSAGGNGGFTVASFKELFTKGITGFGGTTSFQKTIVLKKGEVLDFEVGNGGDGYFDDALQIELKITKS